MPNRSDANRGVLPAAGRIGEEPRLLLGARFVASAAAPEQLPAPDRPEVAFAGRSNAGKSSAINALTGRRALAFASKLPGRTQLLNLFDVPSRLVLVDLPGYGYSRVGEEVRRRWQPLLEGYLLDRPTLAGVVVMMDIRHPMTSLDVELLRWLHAAGRRLHILLTKSDKVSRAEAARTLASVQAQLLELGTDHRAIASAQLFSSTRRQGIAEVEAVIGRWAEGPKEGPWIKGKNPGANMP